MKLMITPAEVALMAFGGENALPGGVVDEAVILSAQQKYIKPVLGGLWEALEAGKYADLLAGYVKPALAQWVRFLVLPALSARAGNAGVVQYGGTMFTAANDKALGRLLRRARGNAVALTRALVENIEANGPLYPEYSVKDNIRHAVNIDGGIFL